MTAPQLPLLNCRSSRAGFQQIAQAAQRDELYLGGGQFFSQPVDHHFDGVGLHVSFACKHQFAESVLGQRMAWAGKLFQMADAKYQVML